MNANIAKKRSYRVASALMAGALLSVTAMPAAVAFAEDVTYPTATVTISPTSANAAPNTYKAYKVFNALIDTDATTGEHNATYIEWAPGAQTPVMNFLHTQPGYSTFLTANGYSGTDGELPQVAAEYISQAIKNGQYDTDFTSNTGTSRYPSPAGASFATDLAQVLAASNVSYSSVTAGTAFNTGTEGYWLFVSNDNNVGVNEAATAPIWFPLGGSATTIYEKSALPSITKQITDDRVGATPGNIADANQGQPIKVTLTATMPENIGSFESYAMTFTDTLNNKIAADISSVTVKVYPTGETGGQVTTLTPGTTTGVSKNYDNNVVRVSIADIKSVIPNINKNSLVVVEYNTSLTTSADKGATGNITSATLTYTSDPVSLATQVTNSKTVSLTAYQIDITKVDKQTHKPLPNVGFKLKIKAGDQGSADNGKYITSTGAIGTTDASSGGLFTTNANGQVTIPLLDAGTYTLEETVVPDHYNKRPNIDITISSTLGDQVISNLTVTSTTTDNTALATDIVTTAQANANNGIISLTTSNDKKIAMPITGMDGVTAALVYGGAAIAIGLSGWVLTRRKKSNKNKE